MTADVSNEKLSRISTLWTLIHKAHGGSPETISSAQRLLMQRYCGAAYRYLLGALRSEEEAMELFQEFALRFIRGDFHRANPERGRFRDYVKTALINLVNDHFRSKQTQPQPLPSDLPDNASKSFDTESSADVFIQSWREELINRVWLSLAESQPTYHAVLLLHVQNPDLHSTQLAEQLTVQLCKPFTAGNIRVTLHRARERFAELLEDEVKQSLESPTENELIQELKELRLFSLCRPAKS